MALNLYPFSLANLGATSIANLVFPTPAFPVINVIWLSFKASSMLATSFSLQHSTVFSGVA